jgi:hypothetical protein
LHKITRLRNRAGNTTEAAQEIANKLARHFARTSSTANYNTRFQKYKERVEKNPPNIQHQHEAGYNNPLIMEELEDALEGCKGTSPGPDLICYEMVKEMGYTDKEHLLESYNKIWSDGTYPEDWKLAHVIANIILSCQNLPSASSIGPKKPSIRNHQKADNWF